MTDTNSQESNVNAISDLAKEGLSIANSGVTLAAALGLGALGHSWWNRITRTYDEQFLIELANHREAIERAARIKDESERKGTDANMEDAMKRLATVLEQEAHERLHFAIARAEWRNSPLRNWTQSALSMGIFLAFMAIMLEGTLITYYEKSLGLITVIIMLLGAFLILAGILSSAFGKDIWISKRVSTNKTGEKPHRQKGVSKRRDLSQ